MKNAYNTEICFMIDMSIPSGQNRFFVWYMRKDSVAMEGLVAHGSCDSGFQTAASFSNTISSGCTSYGKYKIGKRYYGQFGMAFKLHGLDLSNSNAYARSIVLHAYECVPNQETHPVPICNSRGCPMTAPQFLKKLNPIIDSSKRPILLWIFNSSLD